MQKNSFGYREQNNLDNIPGAIDYYKKGLKDVLNEYNEGRSVTQNSIDYINGDSNERANVRVRKMDAPGFVAPSPVREDVKNNPYGQSSYGQISGNSSEYFDQSQVRPGSFGSATTLILIFTAVLVAMVALFSFMILNYIGF